jgi:hypothetical protein
VATRNQDDTSQNTIENPVTTGQTNTTPESQVKQQLPVRIYREILFKRKDIS